MSEHYCASKTRGVLWSDENELLVCSSPTATLESIGGFGKISSSFLQPGTGEATTRHPPLHAAPVRIVVPSPWRLPGKTRRQRITYHRSDLQHNLIEQAKKTGWQ